MGFLLSLRPRLASRSTLVHRLSAGQVMFSRFRRIPIVIIIIVLTLATTGVLALYSAAGGSWSPWAGEHVLRICIGIGLMVAVALVPITFYRKIAPFGWVLALLVLASLEFIGGGQGVKRWLSIGGFNLQPSEPAKLAVILLLAAYFHSINPELIRYIRTYIPVIIIAFVPFIQVLIQPDLGTAIMLLGSAAAVIFVAGIPSWMMGSILGIGLAVIPVFWAMLYDYQKSRILVFFNPGADQLGAGYQITQSKIALGSGGIFGKGYLQGSQARLNYLPEKQTDFVFTMIGEEFGFFGCLFIIGLYVMLVALILRLGMRLHYRFSRLMVTGIGAMLFLYIFVNIAMVTGVIPVVGAPLPLISYGGTALMTVFIAIGLVISAVVYDESGTT
ncbi:MAG: rod shape-determining protein RodA [Candidatus Puniceispirillales bacterium WSBS_2018_MAG_OTU23]